MKYYNQEPQTERKIGFIDYFGGVVMALVMALVAFVVIGGLAGCAQTRQIVTEAIAEAPSPMEIEVLVAAASYQLLAHEDEVFTAPVITNMGLYLDEAIKVLLHPETIQTKEDLVAAFQAIQEQVPEEYRDFVTLGVIIVWERVGLQQMLQEDEGYLKARPYLAAVLYGLKSAVNRRHDMLSV